jgi:hypothetical protein
MRSSETIKPMMVKMKLTRTIYAAQRSAARDGEENATVIDRRYRRSLSAVAADRFDRATFHSLFTKTFFLGRLRLFVNVGMTAVVVALEIRGRSFAAQIAVDALFIDIEFAGSIFGIFIGGVGHNFLR